VNICEFVCDTAWLQQKVFHGILNGKYYNYCIKAGKSHVDVLIIRATEFGRLLLHWIPVSDMYLKLL